MIVYLCPKPYSYYFIEHNIIRYLCNDIRPELFESVKKQWKNLPYMLLNEEDFSKYRSFVIENYNKTLIRARDIL